jgi:hypothetical protein
MCIHIFFCRLVESSPGTGRGEGRDKRDKSLLPLQSSLLDFFKKSKGKEKNGSDQTLHREVPLQTKSRNRIKVCHGLVSFFSMLDVMPFHSIPL